MSEEYFSISTYQFAHNNPVWKIELEGLEGATSTGNGNDDITNYEPVKVKQALRQNPWVAPAAGKVVQKTVEKTVLEKIVGGVVSVAKGAGTLITALLTDSSSPNFGTTNEVPFEFNPIDEKHRPDDKIVKTEGDSDSPIQRMGDFEDSPNSSNDPELGGGAVALSDHLNVRIQDVADKYGIEVIVVGSQASGDADGNSDFDYIINGGNSKTRSSALYRLPKNPKANKDGDMRPGSEILRGVELDTDRPYIRFTPN